MTHKKPGLLFRSPGSLFCKLHAGVSGEATVDGQDHTGNGGSGLVIGEEEHAPQQFPGLSKENTRSAFRILRADAQATCDS